MVSEVFLFSKDSRLLYFSGEGRELDLDLFVVFVLLHFSISVVELFFFFIFTVNCFVRVRMVFRVVLPC